MSHLRVDAPLIAAMRGHAEIAYPRECCGALLGRVADEESRVVAVEPIENRYEGPDEGRRYLISGDDYRRLDARARRASLDILGFYHSHPDHPARPSETDREHALPWYSYVIISVEAGRATDVKSWILKDDRTGFVEGTIA